MRFNSSDARRELQLASIPDMQGSIQANDSKSSAALIVHGLLFAGVVTVVSRLGEVYDRATPGAKIAGYVLLFAAAVAFVLSMLALTEAARPHDPESTREALGDQQAEAYFPPADPRRRPPGGCRGFQEQVDRLAKLKTEDDFTREYAGEQIKLADIRATQAYATKRGFKWLRYELMAVGLFLLLVFLVAVEFPHLARAHARADVSLRWSIAQRGRLRSVGDGGTVIVARRGTIRIGLAANGSRITSLQALGTATWLCRGRTAVPIVEPLAAERQRDAGARRLSLSTSLVQPPCPGGRRPQLRAYLVAVGRADRAVALGQLRLSTE